MKIFVKSTIHFLVTSVAMISARMLEAAPVVYESFNYPVGTLTGQNGGTGFAAGWVATRGANMQGAVWNETTNVAFGTETPALVWNGVLHNSFPTSPATGARFAGPTLSGSSDLNISRTLASSAGAMAGPDGVLWLSSVYHVANTGSGAGINIGLGNGYIYDRGRNYATAINGAPNTTVSFIGVNGYTGSTWNSRLNPTVTAGSWTAGAFARSSGAAALTTTADMIIVLKFTFGPSDKVEAASFTENETINEASFDARKISATHAAGINENTLTVLSISQGRMANAIDEIRLGKTFDDVTSLLENYEYNLWAAQYPGIGLSSNDADSDGLTNEAERILGTNPLLVDTDSDGFSDFAENTAGSNPLKIASNPNDIDEDGMLDTWETANFGSLSHDGTADSDNDLLIDSLEFTLSLNPNNADTNQDGHPDWMGISGHLYVEQWNNVPGATLEDLFVSEAFNDTPNDVYLLTQAKAQSNLGDNYGLRMKGRVIAPVTGSYRFWIAGDGPCSLYLSTDSTAFKRRLISSVKIGSGVEQWDFDASQKSSAINLVAGQEYYIEALMKESTGADHLALAWEYLGQTRQIIPSAQLRSYITDAGDEDGDGMLDTWETSVGLNPNDNGTVDLAQSAYSDIDQDGLLNFEEYFYSGDPHVVGGQKGNLEFDIWAGISGGILREFLESPEYARPADMRTWTGATIPPLGYNYGGRLRGTIKAPESGIYTFWVAGDDQVDLWLSSGESRFDKERIAFSSANTLYQNWLRYGNQQSKPVWLEQGQDYYVESLVKNSSAGGDMSIGWLRIADSAWTSANIALSPADWNPNGPSTTVTAAGGLIGGASDAFSFRYFMLEGDGELIGRLEDITGGNGQAQAGLMIRESLETGARYAMMQRQSDGRLVFQHRGAIDGLTQSSSLTTLFPSQWLKISRKENQIFGYFSPDGKTWQERGRCSIAMNQTAYVGFAVAEVVAGNGVRAVWHDVSVAKRSLIEVVPSEVLTSVIPDANDTDDDGLPDLWERAKGLDATTAANGNGQYGDPDADGFNNLQEYQMSTDPMLSAPILGYLSYERWTDLDATINELVRSPKMLVPAAETGLLTGSEYINMEKSGYAQRTRGLVVAPVTGNYRFWISGNRDFELWLSKDASKFHKQKIAGVVYDAGVTTPPDFRDWDRYSSQMSGLLFLEAGQAYYIEILHQDNLAPGHFSVAWSYTDQMSGVVSNRELIPASQLRSYVSDPNDMDDDYLPDDWEVANGLSPQDNGIVNPNNGNFGDFDADGLSNADERRLGTRADLADSDGDGVTDRDEIEMLETQALMTDAAPFDSVATIPGASFTAASGSWIQDHGKARQNSVRGWLEYPVSLPVAGVYQLDLAFTPVAETGASSDYEIVFSADGKTIQRETVTIAETAIGHAKVLSPWLAAGTHTIRVFIDNSYWFRRITVDQLEISAARGPDANSNSIPDWVDLRLAKFNSLEATSVSFTSPACLEGRAKWSELTTIAGAAVQAAPNDRWYADVPLHPALPSQITVSMENGGLTATQQINWLPTNLLNTVTVNIRLGDSLKLSAFTGALGTPEETVTLSVEGEITTITADQPLIHAFTTPGSIPIQVTHSLDGHLTTTTAIINVVAAPVIESPVCVVSHFREVSLPALPPNIIYQLDDRIEIRDTASTANGIKNYTLRLNTIEDRTSIFRLGGTGPVIATLPFRSMRIRTAGETTVLLTGDLGNNTYSYMMPVILNGLYAGVSAQFDIIISGVFFDDGTLKKVIKIPDDFTSDGEAILNFIKTGTAGANCHRTSLWQSGKRIAYFQ